MKKKGKIGNEKPEEPFWDRLSKLQKILTCICGFGTLITLVYGGYTFISQNPKFPFFYRNTVVIKKSLDCSNIEVKSFNKMPYYLIPTMISQPRDFLYWFRLTGKNECEDGVRLKLRIFINRYSTINANLCKMRLEQINSKSSHPDNSLERSLNDDNIYIDKTLKGGDVVNYPACPKIEFLTDPEGTLIIDYELLLNNDTNKVEQKWRESIRVTILKNLIYWDLKDGSGIQVNPEFLIASLGAWTNFKTEQLEQWAKKYLTRPSPNQDFRQWLKKCYHDLFEQGKLKVRPYPRAWPMAGQGDLSKQTVRSPVEFIGQATNIDPLEAVLLIAALVYNLEINPRPDLTFFAFPKSQGEKRFLLAWYGNNLHWNAIDLTSPYNYSFEKNEKNTTKDLDDYLKTRQNIKTKLIKEGVYPSGRQLLEVTKEDEIVALDFTRAIVVHNIKSLPGTENDRSKDKLPTGEIHAKTF